MCYVLRMAFVPHNNFDQRSFKSTCPVTGLGKQGPAHGNNGGDEFVFRGPEIKFHDGRGEVSLGHFDLRPAAIEDAAREHLGMYRKDTFEMVEKACHDHQNTIQNLEEESLNLQLALDVLILQDAEYVVQLRALELELQEAYKELYEDADGEDLA